MLNFPLACRRKMSPSYTRSMGCISRSWLLVGLVPCYLNTESTQHLVSQFYSVYRIVTFPANKNRKILAELTSVHIGIGIVCEFQNLRIWIVFIRQEVFGNNSWNPEIIFLSLIYSLFLVLDLYIFFSWKNLTGKQNHSKIISYFTCILNPKIKYSWIIWKIFMNYSRE